MRKHSQRVLVFIASFTVGVCVTWLSLLSVPLYGSTTGSPCDHNCVIPRFKSVFRDNQGRIETHFLGFVEGKYGPRAQFEIVNNGNETAYYAGLARDHNAMETVIINDQKQREVLRCGNVVREYRFYHLHPGESLAVMSSSYSSHNPSLDDEIQVGFSFEFKSGERHRTFWSEKFPVPPRLKALLIQ